MELIRQIREAENKAKDMVAVANAHAVSTEEAASAKKAQAVNDAAKNRRVLIENATAEGTKEGTAEAEQMKADAQKKLQQLKDSVTTKLDTAADKVLNFIKSQA